MWLVKVKVANKTWTWRCPDKPSAVYKAHELKVGGFTTSVGERGSFDLICPSAITRIQVRAPRGA